MQRTTELRWEPRRCAGDVPSKRSGHSFTEAGNGMAFLFGGVTLSYRSSFDSKADDDGRDVEFDVLDDIANLLAGSSGRKAKTRSRLQSGPTNEMFRLELSGSLSPDGDMYWNRVEALSAPSARWQHTANFSDKLNTIIVFGGFGEGSCRLNDVWMFDVKSETWTQPQVSSRSESSSDPCLPWASGPVCKDSPSPRGAHASALVCQGSCLIIFGGYGGGGGHTRRDLSDIHAFDIPSCQWHTVVTTGAPPPARSGHRLLVSLSNHGRDNLFVMGGWSACQQFDDVCVLDNDGSTLTWSKVDTASGPESWGPKRWNFGAVSVPAVPNWKIFVFGGNSGELDQARPQGILQNNLQVLECAPLESSDISWYHPIITGESPCARSDTSIIHCKDSGKIFFFGGWSTRWHDDMFTCNVSDIVGPPYNIFSIKAVDWDKATSPITGGTELTVSGQGFCASSGGSLTAVVKFECSKGFREVTGDLKGDTDIVCKAPEFSMYGSDEKVNVTVKIGANKFTNNALSFSFFSVTDASQTVAFGPGILSGIGKGIETSFVIQAKDEMARDRVCGMDRFTIKIRHLGDDQPIVNIESHNMSLSGCINGIGIVAGTKMKARAARIKRKFTDGTVPFEIEDRDDGTYLIKYTPLDEGKYKVDIEFDGTFNGKAGVIRGSPFEFNVTTGSDESACALNGNILCNSIDKFIAQLKEFSLSTVTGLGKSVSADDLRSLVAVKEHLRNISQRKTTLENGIAANRSALIYLKEHSFNVPSLGRSLQDMDSAISAWNTARAILPETTERISNVDEVWREKIRFKIEAYNKELEGKHELFRKLPFWFYHSQKDSGTSVKLGCDAAKQAISRSFTDLESETHNLDENAYLCNIFELGGLIAPSRKHVEDMKADLVEMTKLWEISEKLEALIDSSKTMFWKDLNLNTLDDCAKSILKEVKALHKCTRWCDAFTMVDKICKDFLATIPLIVLMGSKCMRPRHWKSFINITGAKNFVPPCDNESVPLGDILTINLLKFSNDVEEICDQALKEDKMETTLKQIEERWSCIDLVVTPYEKKLGGFVETVPMLGIGEEDFESLENDQLLIQGMMASRYLAQFEQEVTGWQRALFNVSEVFLLVNDIQRTWSYLEPLFIHSEEVMRELPEDATRFITIDIDTRSVLHKAWNTKNINRAFNENGLIDKLEGIQEQLDICKKSLSDFLDGRRRQFPRYYFVSEADLLDILANGGNPEKILSHISKVYLSTKTLTLSEDKTPMGRPSATDFISAVGDEVCTFEPAVPLEGKVEVYMQTILDAQKKSIFETVKRSLVRYHKMPRHEWVLAKDADTSRPLDPAQTTLLVLAINYVKDAEDALTEMSNGVSDALTRYSEKQVNQLSDLIKLTHTDLSKGDRTRVMVCITMDAHARDVVEKMIKNKVFSIDSFIWQSQLKHKFRVPLSHARYKGRDPHLRGQGGERAEVAICDAILPYDYEYLGNGPRLVITPLTDRVYVTATQALNLKMGCAPAGPAGTGKTETTKDLANAVAKLIYVINCSPEMDYKGLGNIFKGVASSGAWVCFDEFNRLVPEVLSVCTVQFKSVCDGIAADATRIRIEGDEINLDPTCGAFITMNPGYLGRSELPEGLKSLFRPMTVMVPDLILICENMLMAEGFVTAKALASKFFCLYSLLKALLSAQLHYDWGLRAIKSVLVVAGGFKRAEPDLAEDALLMRALRDFNIPKIVRDDEVIFFGLLGDLFPGLDPPRKRDESLEAYVNKACAILGNNPDETFCLKVVQTEELLAIRHCVFIMGPAGSGKSQCWRTLKEARNLRDPDMPTKVVDINPKAVKTEDLYGYISMATREWKDGLLSNVMRHLSSIPDENPKWIVMDGDLDANWIESMNSVMDDNHMLTLASNERIPLLPHMRLIFEIRDLKHATPATVSRAGILYISTEGGSQWKSLISSWISKKGYTEDIAAHFRALFDKYVSKTLVWLLINTKSVVAVEDMNRVQVLLNMLNGCLNEDHISNPSTIETAFVYCAVWALGSTLTVADDGTDYRKSFSEWWRDEFKDVKFPSRDTVFEYWLDPASNAFDSWTKSPFFYSVNYDSQKMSMTQVTVPTPETCSVAYWMDMMVRMRKPVMLAGPAGTGKTQLVTGMMKKFKPSSYTSATINFNFYTTSAFLADTMAIPLEKKTGSNYGPPGQTKLVYFIDDLNLPEVDAYNTQSAIAHLRQHMEYEHCYELQKMTLKNISNTQIVSCMNPTAGCFNINPRLQRWFATFAMGLPGSTSLLTIYQTFLDGHLHNFTDEIKSQSANLIKAALGLHSLVSCTFRKTATNFHYEFNIRHISNVFQGLLVSTPENFKSIDKFTLLWLHESERVYGDRLVSAEDLSKYNSLAQSQCKKVFPSFPTAKYYAKENAEPLLFCHFAEGIEVNAYNQVSSLVTMSRVLEEGLKEYNESNTLDLVLFEDAMKHVARIVRIVQNEGGHALLVGVGGSGKQSLARLAAFICGYSVVQIVISSSYSINDLKDDLKAMCIRAGVKEEGVMFLLTDSQIINERFLIYINDLLASGDVPDLFAIDEIDAIVNAVTSRVKEAGIVPERKNCWDFFVSRIRKNLHVCLCFSPVGDGFRNRARRFPALVNCTVIDMFQPWPKDALLSVGRKFLSQVDLGSEKERDVIERFLPFSFEAVNKATIDYKRKERRSVYTTPKSYLELIKLYKVLLEESRSDLSAAILRLDNGLMKLRDTSERVAKLEHDLKGMLEDAAVKKEKAELIAATVSKEKAIAEVETAHAQMEKKQVAKIAEEVGQKQGETENDLAKAEPAVEAAMQALDTLDQKDLSSCKGMLKPPPKLDEVFAATMCLLAGIMPSVVVQKNGKVKDVSWDAAKKQLMGNIKEYMIYLKEIKTHVDNGTINPQNFKEVREYIEKDYFNVETIRTKNQAAAGLCSFVLNIVTYYDIVVTVEPKRHALAEANKQLTEANEKLKVVMENVDGLEKKLATLTKELEEAEASKKEAMDAVAGSERKLNLAQRLTNALSSENRRWAENIITLRKKEKLLTGDVLLASAFISYIGPFTKPFRIHLMEKFFRPFLIKEFGKIAAELGDEYIMPLSEAANPILTLTTPAEVAQWNADSLPADAVSTENGCLVCNSSRWPLIIDPQLQGIKWIKQKESCPQRNLQVVRLGQKDLIRKLEYALENGFSILIENLGESIDAVLMAVIQRATIKRGTKLFIKIGDKEVDFHPDFRMYLHTKLSNPHYPPEIQAETTLINFTVTMAGLEDQLLNLAVEKERPDLAALSSELIAQQNGFKIKMKELEDDILQKLAMAEGDITENVALIEGLEETKRITDDIQQKSELALKTQTDILATSEKYRSVANRGSLLFFLMTDLVKIHTYYIYSLAAFQEVFFRGIENSGNDAKGDNVAARCDVLCRNITLSAFNYIRRGLFEADKLTVAALLTFKILVNDGKIESEEVEFLINGGSCVDPGNMGPLHDWMPDTVWSKVKALECMPRFKGIGDSMQSESDAWEAWFDIEKVEEVAIPGAFNKKLNDLDRMMLLRATRPDRLMNSLISYVGNTMGPEYIAQKPFSMASTFGETNKRTPIFFVLFPGVDPTPWVECLGKEKGISAENKRFINISMGQGQEAPAEAIMTKLAKEGGWVMLQNCHLMSSWVPKLERLLEVVTEDAHEDFRCFISAEPPPIASMNNMPESLMQSCVKVANEASSDVKNSLLRAWDNFSPETYESCCKPNEMKACLFSLCWFHAVVCGRRRFGQQGWSRNYSFNTGDLIICSNVLKSYLDTNVVIPWDDLRYIFGEIMYGGHITDAWDRRTCNTYLQVYQQEDLFCGLEFAPGFKSPCPNEMNYDGYIQYTETSIRAESPLLFGLHPNAEIGYLTNSTEKVFFDMLAMGGGADGGLREDSANVVREVMTNIVERLPEEFEMVSLTMKAKPLLEGPTGPYIVVALQECGRMNALISEIRSSVSYLDKGLKGQLNMSQAMEDLVSAFVLNQWPGRNPFSKCMWEKLAWPSQKNLMSQFADVLLRIDQLVRWTKEFETPKSIWLPGLFNPSSYLTAAQQVTARKTGLALDKMTIETHMTTMWDASEVNEYAKDGTYIHGLYIEGARWPKGDEAGDPFDVNGTPCAGSLCDSKLKELIPPAPVIYVKSVPIQPQWEASAVGYLRHDLSTYECPVYMTSFRGPTFIFMATLRSKEQNNKWTLLGVALLLQTDL